MNRVLIVAEHDGAHLNPGTAKCVSCAAALTDALITVVVLAKDPAMRYPTPGQAIKGAEDAPKGIDDPTTRQDAWAKVICPLAGTAGKTGAIGPLARVNTGISFGLATPFVVADASMFCLTSTGRF